MNTTPTRAIVAKNVNKLIAHDAKKSGDKPTENGFATRRGLDVKMINRLTKAQHDPTLSTLDKIADACGIQAWQLLLEDFDPAHPPSATITDDERKMLSRLRRILDSE